MAKIYLKLFVIAAMTSTLACSAVTTTNTNTVIAFLNGLPKNSTECTPEALMNLLTEESQKWVESVECQNVDFNKDKAGIKMLYSKDNTETSYIKIKFKSSCIMQAISVFAYGNYLDNKDSKVNISINNDKTLSSSFGYSSDSFTDNYGKILNGMSLKTDGANVPSISMTELNLTPIRSLCVEIPIQNQNANIQFYGFRIFHNNSPLNEDGIGTEVENLFVKKGVTDCEYYDLMGRRLAEAPQSGVYVRKCGGKVEKLIANGR